MSGPIGENDFSRLRDSAAYADKTGLIAPLLDAGPRLMLLRPPRFGKTLTLSMLEAYFSGRHDIFAGLEAASGLRLDFTARPVVRLDLGGGMYSTPGQLAEELRRMMRFASKLDIRPGTLSDPASLLRTLRRRAEGNRRVALLIDNFDAPLDRGGEYAPVLIQFLRTLESCSADIEFCMLTGTRHDARRLLAPALDNVRDISADDDFATLCGITQAEAEAMGASDFYARCGGYRFSGNGREVASPDILMRMLTGTADIPPFRYPIPQIGSDTLIRLREVLASGCQLQAASMVFEPLVDAGVLTIRGYDPQFNVYNLGFPNAWVENDFFSRVLAGTSADTLPAQLSAQRMAADLSSGNPEAFLRRMQALLGSMSYQIRPADTEGWYHGIFYCISRLVGLYAQTEISTSAGRIDLAIETVRHIYIFEFKLNTGSSRALTQIERLRYAERWEADPRILFKIGVNFSADTHNISDWRITQQIRKEVAP